MAASLFDAAVRADLAGQIMVRAADKPRKVVAMAAADATDEPQLPPRVEAFLDMPWDDALQAFRDRGIVKPTELRKLLKDYGQRSEAAKQLMIENVQAKVRDELERAIETGVTLPDFAKSLRENQDLLGITTDDPAYLECLPGDTLVSAAVVTAAHRRWHEGAMVEVVTGNGRKFSATTNHPMLTRTGWRTAGELREGDDLVGYRGQQHSRVLREDDIAEPPASIAEMFDACALRARVERVVGSAFDFHGDGSDRDVDVVRTAWDLRVGGFVAIREPLGKHVFADADVARSAFCLACGNLVVVTQRCGFCDVPVGDAISLQSPPDRVVAGSEALSEGVGALAFGISPHEFCDGEIAARSLAARRSAVGEEAGARIAQRSDRASLSDDVEESTALESHLGGNTIDAHAGDVEFDRVVSVSVREFAGHVYNLSTTHGYFAIDGLVTGNTVFRTNVQTAYGAGRLRQIERPAVREAYPFVEFQTVGDARVRDAHKQLEGLVFRVGSPAMRRCSPPCGYNCRCSWGLRTAEDVEGREITESVPPGAIDPDFDGPPTAPLDI